MTDSPQSLTARLQLAIAREDRDSAVEAAHLLYGYRDKIRVKARAPTVDYFTKRGSLRGWAVSIHSLYVGKEKLCQWVRQSLGGCGLDLNHPEVWAAVAADPELTRYVVVMKAVLDELGIDDQAPEVPEPKVIGRGGDA